MSTNLKELNSFNNFNNENFNEREIERESSLISNDDSNSINLLEYSILLEEAKQHNFNDFDNSHCLHIFPPSSSSLHSSYSPSLHSLNSLNSLHSPNSSNTTNTSNSSNSTQSFQSSLNSPSSNNLPIILFIPELALNKNISMNGQLKRLVLYFLKLTFNISLSSYSLIYAHTNLSIISQNTLIQQFHKTLPITIRKNIKKLYVLHPTFLIKFFYETAGKWFLSQKFYRKLSFYDTTHDFQATPNAPLVTFPPIFIKTEDLTLGFRPVESLPPLSNSFEKSIGTTKILFLCINYLRQNNGVRSKGLFRLAGDRILEELVKTRLCYLPNHWEEYVVIGEYNTPINFTSSCPLARVVVDDIDTIGCIIKMSLRDLPEPLIPYDYYDYLMKITMQLDHGIDRLSWEEMINRTIASIPFVNSSTLNFLLR